MQNNKIKLVEPKLAHKEMMLQYVNEFISNNELTIPGSLSYPTFKTYEAWLETINVLSSGQKYQEYLPAKTFFIMNNNESEIIGIIQFRKNLNEYLTKFGGHIGYSIKPNQRKLGYMTIVLNLLIEWIKVNDPIEELLFITTSDNLASQKVITNIGSNFVDQIFDRQHNRTVYRYKYSLTKKLKK